MTQQPRLIVMRHAKAEPFGSSDRARELTDRGRVDAAAAGTHLANTGSVPDYAVVSPAERAVGTWASAAVAAGATIEASLDEAVYHGNPDTVLEALRLAPEDAGTVMLVGHNPTASYLCHLLDDGEGDPAALRGLLRGFPPAALAVFEVGVPWTELAEGSGRLVDFFQP